MFLATKARGVDERFGLVASEPEMERVNAKRKSTCASVVRKEC